MRGDLIRKAIGVILLIVAVSIGFSNEVKEWIHMPTNVVVFEDEEYALQSSIKTMAMSTNSDVTEHIALEVAGFPLKAVDVNVLPKIEVIPGGQSIGVKLNTEGVLVVGHHLVETEQGKISPGEIAGIQVGDMITKINEHPIKKMNEVSSYVQAAGKEGKMLTLEIKRDNETVIKELMPQKATGEQTYRMGLYIRDSAAGVGTLTFFDPITKKYGALGHVISDVDTQKPIVVHDGEIVRSSVTSIEKGSNGDPGEKLASFSGTREKLGTIEKNSSFGIFGTLKKDNIKNNIYDNTMPIALSNDVKEGPATILTVVDGETVEQFDIEIVSSVPQKEPATKGMVIKVTDPKLIEATGGIVQGMSGSPIIQDGKLIGAVTHVFVNDPTSGYGCHISWMLEEAGIMNYSKEAKAS